MKKKVKKISSVNKKERRLRIIVSDNKNFKERVSFPISLSELVIAFISLIVIIFIASFFLISYTSLKNYIPGYFNKDTEIALYKLNILADSLEKEIKQKDQFLHSLKMILNNEDISDDDYVAKSNPVNYDTIKIRTSVDDSLFRAEFENEHIFNLYYTGNNSLSGSIKKESLKDYNFFTPLSGIVTSHFDAANEHFGIDIASAKNEIIKATLQGTVIFSNWTLATGNVLAIQHPANIISVYKHCSDLLVKEGDVVKAGDPVAMTGDSGLQQTGIHLHFEIWYNGTPVNPEKFILFE